VAQVRHLKPRCKKPFISFLGSSRVASYYSLPVISKGNFSPLAKLISSRLATDTVSGFQRCLACNTDGMNDRYYYRLMF